jgi:uncharacterized membrane-anchored protein
MLCKRHVLRRRADRTNRRELVPTLRLILLGARVVAFLVFVLFCMIFAPASSEAVLKALILLFQSLGD